MTKKHSTKRSLVMSLLSLLLCFSMLVGTTYAWFTDSVTSANNIITAGNLDVSLEHADTVLGADEAGWTDASSGPIFNYSNWEPGYTAVKYVKIENEGSLDLKFILNIIPNNEAEDVNLADVIEVYMVGGAVAVDRDALTTESAAYVGTLTSLMSEKDGAAHGVLYADAAKGNVYEIYTIALKMSTSAGNEYMGKSVGGGFAVQLLATQLASEEDSFGPDYDEDAVYPEVELNNIAKEEGTSATVATDIVKVDIPATAPAGNYTVEVTEATLVTDAEGNSVLSMDITLKHNGVKVTDGSATYTVSVNVGIGKTIDGAFHKDVAITNYTYDQNTGILTFDVGSFSPFSFSLKNDPDFKPVAEVVRGGKVYARYETLTEALAAVQDNDTVALLADVELDAPITVKRSITLDGNGKKITQSADCNNNIALIYFEGRSDKYLNVTVEDLTVDGFMVGAAIRTLYTHITIDGCVFSNGNHTVGQGLVRLTYGDAVIKNTTFSGNTCSMGISFNWDASEEMVLDDTIVVDNCLFEDNSATATALIYYVKGVGCTINNSEFVDNKVNCSANGAVIYLGFMEDCVATGNLFKNNVVTDTTSSTRVAGAIFFGYDAEISGNAFVNNTASNANGDTLGQICTSTYYDCKIDLSGNYWGGEAPVYGKDYTIQHQTGSGDFILDNYYTSYTLDAEGNVVLDGALGNSFVAKIGTRKFASFSDALKAAADGDTITLLTDVEGSFAEFKNVTLATGVAGGVTLTNTESNWIYMTNVTIGNGVTLDMDNVYYTNAGVNVIEGTLKAGTLYNANNSKITVQNGGNIITTGMIVNRYHTAADAGIYVYGDNDASTVEISCADTIGTYSGTFYAKDAVVESKMLWIDYLKNSAQEDDTYSQSKPVFENATLVVASELRFYKDATLTLTDSSVTAGKVQIRANATPTITADANSVIKAATVENLSGATLNAVLGEDGTVTFKQMVARVGDATYGELSEAITAAKSGDTIVLLTDLTDTTVKLPAQLHNVTFTAADGVVVRNSTIMASDGNSVDYDGLTFDGILFENSNIVLTGWRNSTEIFKNITIKNCVFQNLVRTGNIAAVHLNMDSTDPLMNFTFVNNTINGVSGSSNSGIYCTGMSGNILIEGNVIHNVAFRPYVIHVANNDGVADTLAVRGNTFSGSNVGRLQALGTNAAGTDAVTLIITENVIKDITSDFQLCYWNFNTEVTTTDFSKNYYDIDVANKPGLFYYNSAAGSVEDLVAMGVYPFYSALNTDGTIDTNSLVVAPN